MAPSIHSLLKRRLATFDKKRAEETLTHENNKNKNNRWRALTNAKKMFPTKKIEKQQNYFKNI
jgi:hypothetical protein